MIGRSIGNYRITGLLGEGGMGTVYLAEHPGLGRRGAVKILRPELTHDEQMVQRFFNEARAAHAVGHPGIVEIWDFGRLPTGEPYLMMEYLIGQSLAGWLRKDGCLRPDQALEVADQAASALGSAHDKGIIHRDLKPDNVFLVADPTRRGSQQVKILDFGIAKLTPLADSGGGSVTRTDAVLGTPRYMSPEQCRATKTVDHRTDIYSLGVILYEMLAGTPPFASESPGELVHMHIGVQPPPLRQQNPDLPVELERIVARMLEKDSAARFQSMADLRRALAGGPYTVALEGKTAHITGAGGTSVARRSTFTEAAAEVVPPPAPQSSARPHLRWAILALAGCAGVAIALLAILGTTAPVSVVPPVAVPALSVEPSPAVAPPAAAAPVPALPPRQVSVAIASVPPGARVVRERDGSVLGLTPLKQEWPAGEGAEALRLEHEGYRRERVVVPLDQGADLDVALGALPAAAPRVGAAKPPAQGRARPPAQADADRAHRKVKEPLKI